MQEKTAIKFKRAMVHNAPKIGSEGVAPPTTKTFATDKTASFANKQNRMPQEKSSFAPVKKSERSSKPKKHSSDSSSSLPIVPSTTAKFQ